MNLSWSRSLIVAGSMALWLPLPGSAQSFGAGISPSKFELRARQGQVLRDTVTVVNPDKQTADYKFRTADWRLSDTGNVEFFVEELQEGSCRSWVRLERKTVSVRGGGLKRYRVEIHVPEDAAPGLCSFAIMIEPGDEVMTRLGPDGQLRFPVVGRYAVITYVTVGDAKAKVDFLGMGETMINDQRLPTLRLRNDGNTYDRAFGQVMATDADGRRIPLIASTFPVLPGRTEEIVLAPESPERDASPVGLSYPLALKGKVEIAGTTIKVDDVFE